MRHEYQQNCNNRTRHGEVKTIRARAEDRFYQQERGNGPAFAPQGFRKTRSTGKRGHNFLHHLQVLDKKGMWMTRQIASRTTPRPFPPLTLRRWRLAQLSA